MLQPTNSLKAVSTACKVHGQYLSTRQGMPYNGGAWSNWTGCPSCNREHAQAARGQGIPSLKIISRPEYRTVLTSEDGTERETYPDLDDAMRLGWIGQAAYDHAAAMRAC